MVRIKRGVTSKTRHKKILKQAKGYYGARSRSYRSAFQAIIKSGQYAYRDRKQKKRKFRQLWIIKINAAARKKNISYSSLIYKLKKNNININRKMLANIALSDNLTFNKLLTYSSHS
ncbi:50S ribosomal protein L20 [Enterobacteriaceae endosymbiont of Donacia cincticornis]|uniref:50S ribosomal protein L20 n=1 Tax=Enterobacteriaceae endosymbiont of Donacia cincticornis TaxID=2675773 RepID=UPI001448B43E|nr:50S ribosomal protein L20 [Enterobacteriaceae endosymbiont of Donacia cincticornis]QJC36002.1 50S ribosomal protein L20 [Enterobacteriaceae endosymbiont of Donacia cincticornis]